MSKAQISLDIVGEDRKGWILKEISLFLDRSRNWGEADTRTFQIDLFSAISKILSPDPIF